VSTSSTGPEIPATPEEVHVVAGEYVLGTLDARVAEAVRAALPTNAALAAAVAGWERRLDPLTRLAPEIAPPQGTWEKIAARIALPAAPARDLAARASAGWRRLFGAGLAGAAVAGLAVFLAVRPPAPVPAQERYVAVMQADQAAPAWVVQAERGGAISVAAINRPAIPEGRVMQVWGLAPGDPGPTSLGFVPTDGTRFTVDASRRPPVDGMLVEISLEPPGGSPIGRPTGPVLFIGRLERVLR
jgi:anti-sigma-K factor RskA